MAEKIFLITKKRKRSENENISSSEYSHDDQILSQIGEECLESDFLEEFLFSKSEIEQSESENCQNCEITSKKIFEIKKVFRCKNYEIKEQEKILSIEKCSVLEIYPVKTITEKNNLLKYSYHIDNRVILYELLGKNYEKLINNFSNNLEQENLNSFNYIGFGNRDNKTCSICLENIEFIERYYVRCGHLFHSNCINEWLKQSNKCPNCKQATINSLNSNNEDFFSMINIINLAPDQGRESPSEYDSMNLEDELIIEELIENRRPQHNLFFSHSRSLSSEIWCAYFIFYIILLIIVQIIYAIGNVAFH